MEKSVANKIIDNALVFDNWRPQGDLNPCRELEKLLS